MRPHWDLLAETGSQAMQQRSCLEYSTPDSQPRSVSASPQKPQGRDTLYTKLRCTWTQHVIIIQLLPVLLDGWRRAERSVCGTTSRSHPTGLLAWYLLATPKNHASPVLIVSTPSRRMNRLGVVSGRRPSSFCRHSPSPRTRPRLPQVHLERPQKKVRTWSQ